ncbi:hypothetical protein L6452_42074 [Arctium lappa]|uniref:Uncharacterized protein n=1 Tax=Arctium lappa TaxID=4217 RepID=A0ACB8XHG9_ARCLA|nr:hypothetical protein L6452_42074 [Arctium lappa]
MEAALQLIQFSCEFDVDVHGHESRDVLVSTMKRRRKKKSLEIMTKAKGSSTTDITSTPRRFVVPRFEAKDDDEDDKDVAGSTRRKMKKFRSVSEIYKIRLQ